MIDGVGTDIIEVTRIEQAIERHGQRFLDRIFTSKEQLYCQQYIFSARHFAGRFAAKEAVVKALGTGFRRGISWTDIEISNDTEGKPTVLLSSSLNALYDPFRLHLSISHCREYATAVAILEKRK